MKIRNFVFTILLIFLVFTLIGCDNGSATAEPNNLVKVSLIVNNEVSQRSVSVTSNMEWENFTFQYNAVPQWNGTNIQGATDWTNFNYSDGVSLGYFTPGQWIFGVKIFNEGTPIYEGFSSKMNISTSSAEVSVMMRKIITEATIGSISINVTAPTIDGDYLNISCNSGAAQTANVERENGISTFTYSINNLVAGNYTITLTHPSANSGAVLAIDLREGEMAVISGHLDNGIWQVGYITVSVHSITINQNEYGTVVASALTAVAGDRISFTVTPFSSSSVQSLSIVDSESQSISYSQNGNLYSFVVPDDDITINVSFSEISLEVDPSKFIFIVQFLHDFNSVVSFGRSSTEPSTSDYFEISGVKIWVDESIGKLCWYSSRNNILKFKTGSLAGLFEDCTKLTSIDMANIDTSNITSMANLFKGCVNIQSINMANLDTSNVTDMSYMFASCGFNGYIANDKYDDDHTFYTTINITGINTANVTDMNHMFYLCNINSLDVSTFSVENVTDMSYMFAGQWNLSGDRKSYYNHITLTGNNLASWETSVCTNFDHMFWMCSKITSLNISNFDFGSITSTNRMFDGCKSLAQITFPDFTDLTNVTTMTFMFSDCSSLDTYDFEDIFATWFITDNTIIDFTKAPNQDTNDTLPNRIIKNILYFNNSSEVYETYDGTEVILGGGRQIKNQCLKIY